MKSYRVHLSPSYFPPFTSVSGQVRSGIFDTILKTRMSRLLPSSILKTQPFITLFFLENQMRSSPLSFTL